MIEDAIFKGLLHYYEGYTLYKKGGNLEVGYKPDYVLKKGSDYIILESETGTSRKIYVGGMLKAAHFFQGERKGKLIFVIAPKPNTKVESIAKHLGHILVLSSHLLIWRRCTL